MASDLVLVLTLSNFSHSKQRLSANQSLFMDSRKFIQESLYIRQFLPTEFFAFSKLFPESHICFFNFFVLTTGRQTAEKGEEKKKGKDGVSGNSPDPDGEAARGIADEKEGRTSRRKRGQSRNCGTYAPAFRQAQLRLAVDRKRRSRGHGRTPPRPSGHC